MKHFLVGGAVRDALLGWPVKERDWVVVGETPESMVAMGFQPVGKDFPVFLHPDTHEEYALARTERKTAPGYKGFIVHAAPEITLEQDLLRRDLTINAMAMTPDGQLLDPYGGKQDLEQRLFRHVSPAFNEDPVRILRIARFAARYHHLGFKLAEETQHLMQTMVMTGETDFLVQERVWMELVKALSEPTPSAFFTVLRQCGALKTVMPELDALFGVPQPEHYHPEIDTGIHALQCLDQAVSLSSKPEVRFAALVHDLGKAVSPPDNWPHHYQHEINGLPIFDRLTERLPMPNRFKNLARLVIRYHTHCHRVFELRASTLTDLLLALGITKSKNILQDFLLACEADSRGRTGFEQAPYPQAQRMMAAAEVLIQTDTSAALNGNHRGASIGAAIRQLRIHAIAEFLRRINLN